MGEVWVLGAGWVGLALVVAYVAKGRGASALTWFGLSWLMTPILAGLVLLLTVPARH